MTNEITAVREAVEVLTGYGTALSDPVQTLLDLAKHYLEAEGMMPSKKSVRDFQKCATGVSGCECNMKPVHFNEAIDLCTLSVMKRLEGIEGAIEDVPRKEIIDENDEVLTTYKDTQAIAEAIRKHMRVIT